MLKTISIVFGAVMVLIGLLGFIPQATSNGLLLGIFHVNIVHNLIHLGTGIAALLCGITSIPASRMFFQIFGIVYGLVALLGYYYLERPIFGFIAHNFADAILHTVISAASLYLGFGYREDGYRTNSDR
ncbi:MAG: DUF4383 domain-containing protein [Parachlamydia sp.]|nr:DUF4383 domain-containing protein [Parachlamydia sp.]